MVAEFSITLRGVGELVGIALVAPLTAHPLAITTRPGEVEGVVGEWLRRVHSPPRLVEVWLGRRLLGIAARHDLLLAFVSRGVQQVT